jgi:hypothetical protein
MLLISRTAVAVDSHTLMKLLCCCRIVFKAMLLISKPVAVAVGRYPVML